MKKKRFFIGLFTIAIFSSCSESSYLLDNEQELDVLTRSYEALVLSEDSAKIETRADRDTIQAIMDAYVTEMMNRNAVAKEKVMRTAYSTTNNLVAVFKVGSCGSYKELEIIVDCEDRKGKSNTNGNVGDTYVDGNENVHLKFCLVEANRYYPGGVLLIDRPSACPHNLEQILVRGHDTEDSAERNSVVCNHLDYDTPAKISTWFTQIGRNVNLAWGFPNFGDPLYPAIGPASGIKYGLLSNGAASTGTIYFDDEDSSNKNFLQLWSYGVSSPKDYPDGYHSNWGITVDKNTKYSVSVSTDTKFHRNNIYKAYPRPPYPGS